MESASTFQIGYLYIINGDKRISGGDAAAMPIKRRWKGVLPADGTKIGLTHQGLQR
jgi:hypothetical protein